jgi:heat shock protein HslJ
MPGDPKGDAVVDDVGAPGDDAGDVIGGDGCGMTATEDDGATEAADEAQPNNTSGNRNAAQRDTRERRANSINRFTAAPRRDQPRVILCQGRGTMTIAWRPWAMKRLTLLLGLAIATTMLAACSTGATASASSSATPALGSLAVDGKTYLSTEVKGALLVPGTRIRLAFKDGNLNANGGCNTMGGAYTITDGRLSAAQMFMTEMGCDEPRMQQDDWVARLLSGAAITLAGDTLTLHEGAVQLTLVDQAVANPDRPVEGTHWVLDGIASGDAVSSVPAGVTASLLIANGRANVETGCNAGAGTVKVTAHELTFEPIALTKKACEPGSMAVERALVAVLAGTVGYTIDADVLAINAGKAGLTFRAAP